MNFIVAYCENKKTTYLLKEKLKDNICYYKRTVKQLPLTNKFA